MRRVDLRMMTGSVMLELTGKLDTAAPLEGEIVVNGPGGGLVNWDAVFWRSVDEDVRRLRQRIFAATRAGMSSEFAACRS